MGTKQWSQEGKRLISKISPSCALTDFVTPGDMIDAGGEEKTGSIAKSLVWGGRSRY